MQTVGIGELKDATAASTMLRRLWYDAIYCYRYREDEAVILVDQNNDAFVPRPRSENNGKRFNVYPSAP